MESEMKTKGLEIHNLSFKDMSNPVQPITNIVIKNVFLSFDFIFYLHKYI